MKILCLHGFLGRPEDFDFLKNDYDIIAPDLSQYVHLSFEELLELFKAKYLFDSMNILGYSFGARLACRLFLNMDYRGKLICLGGHAGINLSSLREDRLQFENEMIADLEKLKPSQFLVQWNSYGIFKYDKPINSGNFNNAQLFFKNYGLSKQPYLKDLLMDCKRKVFFYYGAKDEKYTDYANQNLLGLNVKIIPELGHRIIHHHNCIKQILREKL